MSAVSAVILVLCLMLPVTARAASGAITTKDALREAIAAAPDGAVLLVNDIDFGSQKDPVVISKSITLRCGKEHGSAVFTYGSFELDGSAAKISVRFENITFYSDADASMIEDSFWDGDARDYAPAIRFTGNVDAVLEDCVFRNYQSIEGANLCADYSDSGARADIRANNCSFLGSAVRDRGGAVLLLAPEGRNNVFFTAVDCSFTGNLSSNRKDALGGGAVYAKNAVLQLYNCSFSTNEASHQYLPPEPEITEAGTEPEQTWADYADLTKGGAIFADNCSLIMNYCRVTQCSASLGGGIALENSEFFFLNGILAHNRAESSVLRKDLEGLKAETGMGGGLYINADREIDTAVINSSFYGNTALNAYGGVCFAGADGSALPYALRLELCTWSGNSTDTAYNMPEVDRSQFQPAATEAPEGEQTEEQKAAAAAAAEAAAEEAYEKALAEALAKLEWTEVPGDIWSTDYVKPRGTMIIDDSFSTLKRRQVYFLHHEQASADNNYTYYAAPEVALAEGFMPNVPSAEFTHVIPNEAFRNSCPLPENIPAEIFAPFYEKVLGTFYPGDNTGGGLSYQLLLDNAVWQTVEANEATPELPVPEKEGYSFDQWQSSDGTPYVAGVSFITGLAPETLQVNAVMHPNTYTLHFTSEAGTQDIQQVYGTPVTLPAASEKKNYDFVSWYKSDGTVAKDGEVYLILGDSSYTAQYTKHFPMQTVMILSAAIALILVYLIIARIVDHVKKTKPAREARKAEKAAQKAAEEKAKAEAQARKVQEKAKQKAAEEAAKQAEKEARAKAKADEEARKAEEKAARTAAKEAEKAAKEAEKAAKAAAKEAGKTAGEAEKKAAEGAAVIAGAAAAAAAGAEKTGEAAVEAAGETAKAAETEAEEIVSEAAGSAGAAVTETAEAAEASVKEAVEAAGETAEKTAEAVTEAAGETVAEAKDAIAAAADTISEALASTADEAAEAINDAASQN